MLTKSNWFRASECVHVSILLTLKLFYMYDTLLVNLIYPYYYVYTIHTNRIDNILLKTCTFIVSNFVCHVQQNMNVYTFIDRVQFWQDRLYVWLKCESWIYWNSKRHNLIVHDVIITSGFCLLDMTFMTGSYTRWQVSQVSYVIFCLRIL